MTIDTNTVISISEANQNFSKVARMVDQFGKAVIFKNNSPKYMVLDFSAADQAYTPLSDSSAKDRTAYAYASSEEIASISHRLIEKYDEAYKELAK